ncbi:MAG: hypothetical protein P4M08_15585 [Oligoflexia bacterium]|nr:hypothetical protein [Oligoflexia bacterium]
MASLTGSKLLLAFFAFATLSGIGAAYAKDPVFVEPPAGFRIGMEIELVPASLANVSGYFDFARLQAEEGREIDKILPDDFFDDYLRDDPQALSTLPQALRQSLTQGLKLESAVIREQSPPVQPMQARPQSLLGADGKPLGTQPKLILPESAAPPVAAQKLILPETTPEAFHQQGTLVVSNSSSWQTLHSRWKALPASAKQSAVRWERLSPLKKAELAIHYAKGGIHVKQDLPPEEAKLFRRLSWSRDGDALEFRHEKNLKVSDSAAFYRDVLTLAARAGVDRKILNPSDSRLKTASFHYHISVAGKDLTRQGLALNRLELVRRVNRGILNDLDGAGDFLYNPTAKSKGLVRIYDAHRLEFRAHSVPLAEELNFNLRVLKANEEEGLRLVDSEIKSQMSDYVVDKIAEHRAEYLADFEPYITAQQRLRVQPKIQVLSRLRNLPEKWSEEVWREVPALLGGKDAGIRNRVSLELRKQSVWPAEFWNQVPDLLNFDSSVAEKTVEAIGSQRNWPDAVWRQVERLMQSEDSQVQVRIATALGNQPAWPSAVWDRILALLKSPDLDTRVLALHAVAGQRTWTEPVRAYFGELLKHQDPDEQIYALHAFAYQPAWSDAEGSRVADLLSSENPSVLKAAFSAFAEQAHWPEKVWQRIPDFLLGHDALLKGAVLRALQGQAHWPESVWKCLPALSQDAKVRTYVLNALQNRPALPAEFWEQVPGLLKQRDTSMVVSLLKTQSSWPRDFWSQVPHWLKGDNGGAQRAILQALESQPSWPKDVEASVKRLSGSRDLTVRHLVASAVKNRTIKGRVLCTLNRMRALLW